MNKALFEVRKITIYNHDICNMYNSRECQDKPALTLLTKV